MGNNIVLRGQTYHFVRRVPRDIQPLVGKRLWKRSLGTGNLREAEMAARVLGVETDKIIAAHRTSTSNSKLASRVKAATDAWCRALMRTEHAARRGDFSSRFTDEILAAVEKRDAARVALANAKEKAVPGADKLLQELNDVEDKRRSDKIARAAYAGVPLPPDATVIDRHWYAACVEHTPAERKMLLRDIELRAVTAPVKEKQLREDLEPLSEFTPLRDDPNNPRITSAIEIWFAERKQGAAAVKRHRVAVRRFVELNGDLPVGEITRGMVTTYAKTIENLTDHRKIPTSERGGLASKEGLPTVAAPTVDRHLITMKALLTFALGKGWIAVNHATGLRAPKDTRQKAERRRSFTAEERATLMAKVIEENGDGGEMTWLIRLGAYTGCRLEEMAQLAKENVKTVDGVAVIEIDDLDGRSVKSRSSVRLVPLHPAIAEGFAAFARSSRGKRVFFGFSRDPYTGRFADVLSADFARLMDRSGLTDRRLVFHSFRHGLKRAMADARVDPEARRAILGHAARDAHEGYEGHSLKVLAEELARVPKLFG